MSSILPKNNFAASPSVPDSIFDRSRMSLDQVQQIGAGTVDRAGKLHLLRRQIPVRVSLSCCPSRGCC